MYRQTSGSIVVPASSNNLVGIKPTVGLTSRNLVIPASEHWDTVGPMARTVRDAALILQSIAGVDPYDNYTSAIPNNGTIPDYLSACKYGSLNGVRFGIPTNALESARIFFGNESSSGPLISAFESAVSTVRAAGATVIENANYTVSFTEPLILENSLKVLSADFISNLAAYLAELSVNPNNITSLASLRAFTQAFPLEEYPKRDTSIWDDALAQGWNNTDPRFWEAYQANLYHGGEGGVLGALQRNNLDAIMLPTPLAAIPSGWVGTPIITVPAGFYPPATNSSIDPSIVRPNQP